MTIQLTGKLLKLVDDKVKAGLYASPQQLVETAVLSLLERSDQFRDGELDDLIAEGLKDVEAGRLLDGEQVFAELQQNSLARRQEKGV